MAALANLIKATEVSEGKAAILGSQLEILSSITSNSGRDKRSETTNETALPELYISLHHHASKDAHTYK